MARGCSRLAAGLSLSTQPNCKGATYGRARRLCRVHQSASELRIQAFRAYLWQAVEIASPGEVQALLIAQCRAQISRAEINSRTGCARNESRWNLSESFRS